MRYIWTILLTIMLTGQLLADNNGQRSISVDGPFVTLADLYAGVPEKLAATQVLITPQPGQSITLGQQWLSSVAMKYGVVYTPQSKFESIKVTGASDMIPVEDIEKILQDHLSQLLKTDAFQTKLDNGDLQLHFPKGKSGDVLVTNAELNPDQTRFTATLILQYEGKELNKLKVAGRVVTMTSVPVLTRAIHKGQTIQADDIEWQNVPSTQLNNATLLEEGELIGATAKQRDLLPNRPLNKHDITIPNMVLRNQAVTIYAESPNFTVTAKGKALENGGRDAYVKIMNVDSQKVIHATVIGPQQVRVDIPMMHTVIAQE